MCPVSNGTQVIGAGAGVVSQGQRQTANIGLTRRVLQVEKGIFNVSNNIAPLTLLIQKFGRTKNVESVQFNHLEDDIFPTTVYFVTSGTTSAAASADDGANTFLKLASGNGPRIGAGDVLKVLRTGEMMRALTNGSVSAGVQTPAPAEDVIQVIRSCGQSGMGSPINANEEIQIISRADLEGSNAPDGQGTEPYFRTNFTQTIRAAVDLSRRGEQTRVYGPDEMQRLREQALQSLMIKVEKALMLQNGISAADPTMTGGLDYWLSTNRFNASGPLEEQYFINCLVQLFRRNQGEKDIVFLAGETIRFAIQGWGMDVIRYRPDDDTLGLDVGEYQTSFGRVKIVPHALLSPLGSDVASGQFTQYYRDNPNAGNAPVLGTPNSDAGALTVAAAGYGLSGMGMFLNLRLLGTRVLTALTLQKNIQLPGVDGKKEGWLIDLGLDIHNEKSHGIFEGVTG